jgi:hypothetical protein
MGVSRGLHIMTDELDLQDLDHLAHVAEGRGLAVPEAAVARLMLAGLVRRSEPSCGDSPMLELTAAGLARVRSSDQ